MKQFTKVFCFLAVGFFLTTGTLFALPSEYQIINPTDLSGAPVYSPGAELGFFIWTVDDARTDWRIRWSGDGTGLTVYSGTISLFENEFDGPVASFGFSGSDAFTEFDSPDSAIFTGHVNPGEDGLNFSITSIGSPSYVAFDLFKNGNQLIADEVFLGSNREALSLFQSANEDADFAIAAPVPEPATMVLLGFGLLGLAGISRKRFKA